MKMRRLIAATAAVVVTLAGASFTAAQPASAKKPVDATTAQLVELMQKTATAWSTLDPKNAQPFYAQDAGLVFYDIAPVQYQGFQAYMAGTQALFGTFSALTMAFNDDIAVHPAGNMAWGTATLKTTATMKDGTKLPLDARWTLIWEKRGKQWLIVHEHLSAPLAMPAGPAPAADKP